MPFSFIKVQGPLAISKTISSFRIFKAKRCYDASVTVTCDGTLNVRENVEILRSEVGGYRGVPAFKNYDKN